MSGMDEIVENAVIRSWAGNFRRSPRQANRLHESDAELVEIPGDDGRYLAVTIDTVAEEIAEGLYRDPLTIGWVTANANLSDLAAVGAEPLGLVLSASMPPGPQEERIAGIARGVEEACRVHGVYVLGGDTNTAAEVSLTACALGLVPREKAMRRVGLRPGDILYATGGMGAGNAMGLVRLARLPEELFPEGRYRPLARLKEGRVIRDFASSCMDTSDGLLATLDQLMRINGLGFEVDCRWETVLHPDVLAFCAATGTPPWMAAAGPHGEFELVFTVPRDREAALLRACAPAGVKPVRLGVVRETPAVSLALPSGRRADVDVGVLRNLLDAVGGDLSRFVGEFRALGKKWGLE